MYLQDIFNERSTDYNLRFFLKMRKLGEEIIDIGREFQILGPRKRIVNCGLRFVRKICATRMRSIIVGRSSGMILHLVTC